MISARMGEPLDNTRTTRRGLLLLGASAGAGLALAACSPDPIPDHGISAKAGMTPIPTVTDPVAALNDVLDTVVHPLAFAYAALASVVDASLTGLTSAILAEHRAHATKLVATVTAQGGTPVAEKSKYAFSGTDPVPSTSKDALTLLQKLEDGAVKRFYLLAAGATMPELVQLAAAIMAADSQHSAALLDRLGQPPVPDVFVSA